MKRTVLWGLVVVGLFVVVRATNAGETLIYFTRHAEDMVNESVCTEDGECCQEILNPVGELRAELLADWFAKRRITRKLTHILASHKIRTRQTIGWIAEDAGLTGDVDQNPGDGIQQLPAFVEECDPDYYSSSASREPMLAGILDIHETGNDNVVLAAGHSPTLYPIMRALGIDTTDDVTFPKTYKNGDPAKERVSGFNNLWLVLLDDDEPAELLDHWVFSFELEGTSTLDGRGHRSRPPYRRSSYRRQHDGTLLYLTRHAEDMVDGSCTPDGECCLEILNPVGELRAELLADWFADEHLTGRLTDILASHKIRTRQTIGWIAEDAALSGDDDLNPGDGIQQLPPFVEECDPGYYSSSASLEPMLAGILDIHEMEPDSVVLAAGHSPTLYPIMRALGIDTTDDVTFPKTYKNGDPAKERVSGFNNLWTLLIGDDGTAELVDHLVFAFVLDATSTMDDRPDRD